MFGAFSRLADRLVSLVIPSVEAGACVDENGRLFWRNCGGCGCSGGRYVRRQCECRINCMGTCVNTGRTRCVQTGLTC
jgi:hypothetical protein